MSVECLVYRCARQPEMYLYVRAGLGHDQLPEALIARTGRLTEVMKLTLTPERKLARVDVGKVIEQLQASGYFLQMPPPEIINAHLHFGD
ncbi:YcgL domain-containing protein [Solimonas terrae]|uniref:YcgL domain-containing protein G7Y85_08060 n=1 Tax=Solimonas terrae TaxID=1396819 RepID=A0A6M2BR51_9GAMM|nr:YcgL domain-containing protein [Solimonas terrae]NGY04715.1 YcgL domain-containing protein [Solimonas terrae]